MRESDRYDLHPLVRSYIQELFEQAPERGEVALRVANWLFRVIIRGHAADHRVMLTEIDNVRRAFGILLEQGRADEALPLFAPLGTYWYDRGDPREALRWHQRFVEALESVEASEERRFLRRIALREVANSLRLIDPQSIDEQRNILKEVVENNWSATLGVEAYLDLFELEMRCGQNEEAWEALQSAERLAHLAAVLGTEIPLHPRARLDVSWGRWFARAGDKRYREAFRQGMLAAPSTEGFLLWADAELARRNFRGARAATQQALMVGSGDLILTLRALYLMAYLGIASTGRTDYRVAARLYGFVRVTLDEIPVVLRPQVISQPSFVSRGTTP